MTTFRATVLDVFDERKTSYEDCCSWMQRPENILSTKQYLNTTSNTDARNFLAYLHLHREKENVFEDNPLDTVLKRVVVGLFERIHGNEENSAISAAAGRIKPMFRAWKERDTGTVTTYLSDRAVKATLGTDADGMTADTLCQWIEEISGEGAAETARQRCSHRWVSVTSETLPTVIAETMEDAFWDHIKEKVVAQDLAPLFDVLHEVQKAIRALLCTAPVTKGSFDDRFDIDWIEDRAKNDVLSRVDVGALVHYLVTIVASIQAPADDDVVGEWANACQEESIKSNTLAEYLPTVVDTVRVAIVHLRRVFARLHALKK